jgi:hypothetical protein
MRRILGRVSVALLVGAISCWGAYRVFGSEVGADGFLREPFALIPLGWLCLFGAIGAGIFYALLGFGRAPDRG